MVAWCRNELCCEPFDWDASTGDGVFCSWECSDAWEVYAEEYEFDLIRKSEV